MMLVSANRVIQCWSHVWNHDEFLWALDNPNTAVYIACVYYTKCINYNFYIDCCFLYAYGCMDHKHTAAT